MKSAQDRRVHTRQTVEALVIADLDTLLIALYVELTDRVIPALGLGRRGPGRPPEVTDAELVCLAVAQVLLRYNDERHWLRAAPNRVGHLFPRLLTQSEYNQRLKDLAPLLEAALRWLADMTPGSAERLRLLEGTPVGCGQSIITAKRSGLFGYAGYGYEPGTALTRNAPGSPSKVGLSFMEGRQEGVESLDRAYDLSSLSGEVGHSDEVIAQCNSARSSRSATSARLPPAARPVGPARLIILPAVEMSCHLDNPPSGPPNVTSTKRLAYQGAA
jgi:hypothetical protein